MSLKYSDSKYMAREAASIALLNRYSNKSLSMMRINSKTLSHNRKALFSISTE
jgi:hypothetical protein